MKRRPREHEQDEPVEHGEGRGGRRPVSDEPGGDLSHVYAWNEVVLHKAVSCSSCGTRIERGERGFAGMSDEPDLARAWLCPACVEAL